MSTVNGIDNQSCADCLRPHHQPLTMKAELVSELLDHLHFRKTDGTGGLPCTKQQRKLLILWRTMTEYSNSNQNNFSFSTRLSTVQYRSQLIPASSYVIPLKWRIVSIPHSTQIWNLRAWRQRDHQSPACTHSGRPSYGQYRPYIHNATSCITVSNF